MSKFNFLPPSQTSKITPQSRGKDNPYAYSNTSLSDLAIQELTSDKSAIFIKIAPSQSQFQPLVGFLLNAIERSSILPSETVDSWLASVEMVNTVSKSSHNPITFKGKRVLIWKVQKILLHSLCQCLGLSISDEMLACSSIFTNQSHIAYFLFLTRKINLPEEFAKLRNQWLTSIAEKSESVRSTSSS